MPATVPAHAGNAANRPKCAHGPTERACPAGPVVTP
jgi:hypothetical protein